MASNTIKALKINEVNINDLELGNCKGDKFVPFSINSNKLVIQTPWLKCTDYPIFQAPNFENIHLLNLYLIGKNNEEGIAMYNFLDSLEAKASEIIDAKKRMWGKENLEVFKSLIRNHPETNRPFIHLPIEFKSDSSIFIADDGSIYDYKDLAPHGYVKAIIDFTGLWINNTECGFHASIKKVKVHTNQREENYVYEFADSDNEFNADNNIHTVMSQLDTEKLPKRKNDSVHKKEIIHKTSDILHKGASDILTPLNPKYSDKRSDKRTDRKSEIIKSERKPLPLMNYDDSDDFFDD